MGIESYNSFIYDALLCLSEQYYLVIEQCVSDVRLCMMWFFFFFKQKTAYEMQRGLVGSEMCIRDSINAEYMGAVSCISHALSNPEIKGKNFAIRGASAISYDGIIDVLTKHSGIPILNKKARCPISGFVEKFIIGDTHDKNMMKMAEWHEQEPQDFQKEENYFEKFKISPKYEFNSFYSGSKAKEDAYMKPYLFEYKKIALDQTFTVSYTHLTLPTILLVQISVVAVSLKKKHNNINSITIQIQH
eukprot:TRINITY_DN37229_c0_g1_i1.p1 TRINITY_DN37229_c0_g1~~TRINITY_DN37229_c0_g1_i1.p1  ORF type:complete len:246 (+),score=68.89 TRINITY_DN37229_c0_g1_i1:8-745(+)